MKRVSFEDMSCSVARSLEVIGEWWTLLIVRDVSLGKRRFDEIQASLGISRNILTARLNKLVDEGVLVRQHLGPSGSRHEYRLTDKGLELIPILVMISQWGDRWEADEDKGPPVEFVHRTCGHVMQPALTCDHCGEEVVARSVRAQRGEGWQDDPDHPVPLTAAG